MVSAGAIRVAIKTRMAKQSPDVADSRPSHRKGQLAKALPLWIEQLGDVVVTPESSYITPFGALRRITPPVCPSISLTDQLEKPGSKVMVTWRAPTS